MFQPRTQEVHKEITGSSRLLTFLPSFDPGVISGKVMFDLMSSPVQTSYLTCIIHSNPLNAPLDLWFNLVMHMEECWHICGLKSSVSYSIKSTNLRVQIATTKLLISLIKPANLSTFWDFQTFNLITWGHTPLSLRKLCLTWFHLGVKPPTLPYLGLTQLPSYLWESYVWPGFIYRSILLYILTS